MFFKDIAGQAALKQKLIKNINIGRISHAQLFVGAEGSGNLPLAIAYARYLCCKNRGQTDACGTCSSCVKYNKLAHPDLNFFYPIPSKKQGDRAIISKDYIQQWRSFLEKSPYGSLNSWYNHIEVENKQGIINAEDCNEVIKVLGYKSWESEYKIVIIWMIERLYHSAAPKLLKILEEPPDKTLFLIISENQDLILNTILSRTQIVKIPRLSDDEVTEGLVSLHNVSLNDAENAAFLADGNFHQALALANNEAATESQTSILRLWLRDCYSYKPKEIMGHVDTLAKLGREKQKNLLGFGLEIFRQCIMLNYNAGKLLRAPEQANDFVVKFSTVLKPSVAMQMSEEFNKAIYHVERNANPKILFTDLSLLMSRIFMETKK